MLHEGLVIAGILTANDLQHDIDRLARVRPDPIMREQVLQDLMVKYWGGAFGHTPRGQAWQQQLESALLQWAQALEGFRTRYRENLRGAHAGS